MSTPGPFPAFVVACGEEASDPLVSHEGRVVRVDQLAASGHLDHQDEDLAAVASLGVEVWRYGMPWRLTEPEPGVHDWSLWDRALAACDRPSINSSQVEDRRSLQDRRRGRRPPKDMVEPSRAKRFARFSV